MGNKEVKSDKSDNANLTPAELWLKREPKDYTVRFTFKESGDLGMRLSQDVPPWVLEVRDGSLASTKAPKVPVGGLVIAVNGHPIKEGRNGVYSESNQEALKMLHDDTQRPVVVDITWPVDVPAPIVKYA